MRRTTTVPLYGTCFIVVIDEGEDINAVARRHKLPAPFPRRRGRAAGATYSPDDRSYVVVFLTPKADMNTIAHEAFHCAQYVAEAVGLDWEFEQEMENEELAYLCGWAAGEIDRRLREYRRTK